MTSSNPGARYLQGSILGHIARMTASGGLGLLAMFAVEFADLFFISLLGESELAAAVGFAGSILFFTQSLSIGLSIAVSALVSKAIGAGDNKQAAEMVGSGIVVVIASTTLVAALVFIFREPCLMLLGAEGETLEHAQRYLAIVICSSPLMAIGAAMSGVMRAQGDAKASLWVTLSGAIVNAVLDPILIFVVGLGLPGAALASVFARLTMFLFGIYRVVVGYRLFAAPKVPVLRRDLPELATIAVPSVLTNLATPIAIAYVTAVMATYGDAAVAGNAIISRIQMVAFVGLYALSGIVGPIAGQNWGAGYRDRVEAVLSDSIRFVVIYCLVVCALLALLTGPILFVFQASDQAAELIRWFTYGLSLVFIFNGMTFVTNALFNNLGAPRTSTVFNVAKATVFTIPFVWLGSEFGGAPGALAGQGAGAVLVALGGYYWCRRHLVKLTYSVTLPA